MIPYFIALYFHYNFILLMIRVMTESVPFDSDSKAGPVSCVGIANNAVHRVRLPPTYLSNRHRAFVL